MDQITDEERRWIAEPVAEVMDPHASAGSLIEKMNDERLRSTGAPNSACTRAPRPGRPAGRR